MMYKAGISREELTKIIVDTVEDAYGPKALDRVDVNKLVTECLQGIEKEVDEFIEAMKDMALCYAAPPKKARKSKEAKCLSEDGVIVEVCDTIK